MAGTRFNAGANAPQFPFQTVNWPSISITPVYHTVAVVPALPVNARPPSADFRRFILSLTAGRGEVDECVRGFYAASDIIGCNHVLYMSAAVAAAAALADPPEDPVPTMPIWCSPWHECYSRLTMPFPPFVPTQARSGDPGQGGVVSVRPIWHACIAIRPAKHRTTFRMIVSQNILMVTTLESHYFLFI